MSVERSALYTERPLPTSSVFDETRGVLCYSAADLNISLDDRLTLASLALRLQMLAGSDIFINPLDVLPSLGVAAADKARIGTESLHRGLYIFRDDPRYRQGEQLVKATFAASASAARASGLKLPFEATYQNQPAVAFSSEDYDHIGYNPLFIVNRAKARTRQANKGESNAPEVQRKTKSSAGQAMASYIVRATRLKEKYAEEGALVRSLYKQVRAPKERGRTPQNQYKIRNLDRDRRRFDVLFRGLIETAAINNHWTSHDIHAAHKASLAERYGGATLEEINEGWRRQLSVYGQYNNARILKVVQWLQSCEVYRDMYRPFIRAVITGQETT